MSDHHSRASTSLQVPKMKGGLLQSGNDSSPAPPLDDKITKMKKRSPVEIFFGTTDSCAEKRGLGNERDSMLSLPTISFPGILVGCQRSLRSRERGGGGECRRIRGYPPAPQTSPESRSRCPLLCRAPLSILFSLSKLDTTPLYIARHVSPIETYVDCSEGAQAGLGASWLPGPTGTAEDAMRSPGPPLAKWAKFRYKASCSRIWQGRCRADSRDQSGGPPEVRWPLNRTLLSGGEWGTHHPSLFRGGGGGRGTGGSPGAGGVFAVCPSPAPPPSLHFGRSVRQTGQGEGKASNKDREVRRAGANQLQPPFSPPDFMSALLKNDRGANGARAGPVFRRKRSPPDGSPFSPPSPTEPIPPALTRTFFFSG